MGAPARHSTKAVHPVVDRLRRLRVAAGRSQAHLAREMHCGPSSIAQLETGKYPPSLPTLHAWADTLGQQLTLVPLARHCRVCGCTRERACDGGCGWVTDSTLEVQLCTLCAWTIARDAIACGLYDPAALEPVAHAQASGTRHFSPCHDGEERDHTGAAPECPTPECRLAERRHQAADDIQDLTTGLWL